MQVFPDLNASRLFLSILPPSENIVLGAAKLIPGVVQVRRTAIAMKQYLYAYGFYYPAEHLRMMSTFIAGN